MSEQLPTLSRREIAAHVAAQAKFARVSPLVEAVQAYVDPTPISRRDFLLRHREIAAVSVPLAASLGVVGALTSADAVINPRGNFVVEALKAGAQWLINRKVESASAQILNPDLEGLSPFQLAYVLRPQPLSTTLNQDYFQVDVNSFPTDGVNRQRLMTPLDYLEFVKGNSSTIEGLERSQVLQQEIINIFAQKGVTVNPDFANSKFFFPDNITLDGTRVITISDLSRQNLIAWGVMPEDVDDEQFSFNDDGTVAQMNETQAAHRSTPDYNPALGNPNPILGVVPSARGGYTVAEVDGKENPIKITPGLESLTEEGKRSDQLPQILLVIPDLVSGGYILLGADGSCGNKEIVGRIPPIIVPPTPESIPPATASATPTDTATSTATSVENVAPAPTVTATSAATGAPTTPSEHHGGGGGETPPTPTNTPGPEATATPQPTPTNKPTPTTPPTPTNTPGPEATATPQPTPTNKPTPTTPPTTPPTVRPTATPPPTATSRPTPENTATPQTLH